MENNIDLNHLKVRFRNKLMNHLQANLGKVIDELFNETVKELTPKPTIKPEAINFKSVLNFDSVEDKIAKERKIIEDYIEKIIKTQFAKAKEKTKNKETEIFAKNILGFNEKTNEYIDKLIELNNEKLAKQNKVVLAIFDLSDMD